MENKIFKKRLNFFDAVVVDLRINIVIRIMKSPNTMKK